VTLHRAAAHEDEDGRRWAWDYRDCVSWEFKTSYHGGSNKLSWLFPPPLFFLFDQGWVGHGAAAGDSMKSTIRMRGGGFKKHRFAIKKHRFAVPCCSRRIGGGHGLTINTGNWVFCKLFPPGGTKTNYEVMYYWVGINMDAVYLLSNNSFRHQIETWALILHIYCA